ncbi:MAG: hypothetical protein ACTSRS_17705 [Candidatus Helarchaeota archaeon]
MNENIEDLPWRKILNQIHTPWGGAHDSAARGMKLSRQFPVTSANLASDGGKVSPIQMKFHTSMRCSASISRIRVRLGIFTTISTWVWKNSMSNSTSLFSKTSKLSIPYHPIAPRISTIGCLTWRSTSYRRALGRKILGSTSNTAVF